MHQQQSHSAYPFWIFVLGLLLLGSIYLNYRQQTLIDELSEEAADMKYVQSALSDQIDYLENGYDD